jgi:hypothetical protein
MNVENSTMLDTVLLLPAVTDVFLVSEWTYSVTWHETLTLLTFIPKC